MKKIKHKKSIGLPGGPNEMFTYVTGVFSTEGYKRNSPDVNNPFNIIPSGNITMKGVDFPVMGTDNLGNSKLMMPGHDYTFPGNMVFETPMAQQGKEVNTETSILTKLNPKNWGVADYSNESDFNKAFSSASKAGEKEFIWNNKRYTTDRAYENPYEVSKFSSSFIPKTYLNNKINNSKDNVVREKRDIKLNEGKLYFQRTNEATEGNIILGGDFVEDEPTAYPAYNFKNNITERYDAQGEKVKLDNETQLYYGIVNNKLKTGKITSFNNDDIVVPIRYGGRYDKKDALSKEKKAIIANYNNIKDKIKQIDLSEEALNNFYKGKERPFWDSHSRRFFEYRDYKIAEILKESNLSAESWSDLKKYAKNLDATFTRDGKPIYNSGVDGKVILHSPSSGEQLFLYKNNVSEVKEKSQEFLKKHPDAEFISLDTGRYNFLVENQEGLNVDDFRTYQESDIRRGDRIGYNIVYGNMMHDYGDGERKKMYYSDKELSELNVDEKNFDTLALQRELSNRGYKLPGSIKEDGKFDGVFGNETKQALLNWQSKNQKQLGGEQKQIEQESTVFKMPAMMLPDAFELYEEEVYKPEGYVEQDPLAMFPEQLRRFMQASPKPGHGVLKQPEPTTYKVQKGDSLSVIAKNNNTTTEELQKLNNIKNPRLIRPNQEIKLPSAVKEVKNKNYTIQSGDTLYGIAKKNNTTVEKLQMLNNIENPSLIRRGATLQIPPADNNHKIAYKKGWYDTDHIKKKRKEMSSKSDESVVITSQTLNNPDQKYIVVDKKKGRMKSK